MPVLRLDRMLSGQGIGTRREIKQRMGKGEVTVNGKIVTRPEVKVDTLKDVVCVHGEKVSYREHVYIMMNKPAGVISASDDPREETVINLLPPQLFRPGLFPAGRLDRDTEGMLLITDDGNFAHDILSPKKHVFKKYFARLDSPVAPEDVQKFENGLEIDGGYVCLPAKLQIMADCEVSVILHEGKFHQVKRMFEALGHKVVYLKRTAMGKLKLDENLKPGEARELSDDEVGLISSC